MVRTRLNAVAPDLEAAIAAVPTDQQRNAAWAAARWALERVGLSHPAINEAVATGVVGSVGTLVVEYDDRYFELQELNELGECTVENVQMAFSLARAAGAVEFAARGEFVEAIYESGIAADDWPGLRLVVTSFLN